MNSAPIAVSVQGVSKAYELWDSPRDRLMFPLRNIWRGLLPSALRSKHVTGLPRQFDALHDVSFEIRKGESWGFIGLNGSGKSTLLKIISGNVRPSEGSVEVSGKVAILDYGSGLNTDFTGRENIYLKGALLGLSRKQIEERVAAIEDFAEIGDFIDQPVKTYSSGMVARLGFAVMAHVDADICITDEALAVGDAFFVQKCMRHIRSFLNRGTFLFVSHSINDVMSLCDHAVWLEKGRVVRVGKASEVCLAYQAAVERRNSEGFVAAAEHDAAQPGESEPEQLVRRSNLHIALDDTQLAQLKHHYVASERPRTDLTQVVQVSEQEKITDVLMHDTGIGGGKIFSVTLTDEAGRALGAVLGNEVVCLTVRAVAERTIHRPIIGFQLKNHTGLTLVAENTFLVTRDQDLRVDPGEILSITFRFAMPLLPVGEYVVRTGFADGVEDNNALLDVNHAALLLRCETSQARHGLVGVPMLKVEVLREGRHALFNATSCA